MILPATARAGRGSLCWRRTHCQRFAHLGTTLLRVRSRNGDFDPRVRRNPTGQERNTIMEPLVTTAAEAADMLGVGCSGVYRLIAAKPLESIKIRRSRHITVASIRHVTAQSAGVELVEARTEDPPSR